MNVNRPYLTLPEMDYLISRTEQPRDRLLLQWLSRSGIRITELLELRIEYIDFGRCLVSIIHQKVRSRLKCPRCKAWIGKTHLFCPKCGSDLSTATFGDESKEERRTIPIDHGTLQLTVEYLAGRKSGRLFEISRQRADQIVKQAAKRVGLDHVLDFYSGKKARLHCHVFRHSFAMHWIAVNGREAMEELRLHLGHKDIKTTMRYLHWSPTEIHKPYDKLWK